MTNTQNPRTLIEAIQYFSDNRRCVEYVKNLRWQDGVVKCPRCESTHVKELTTRQIWQCYGCKKQFSVKVGTVFTDSALPLTKWLTGMWLVMNAKNGISSYEISRSLGISQKSAWHLGHRIREAMANGSIEKMTEKVETDAAYLGGSRKNWSNEKRATTPAYVDNKTPIVAYVERNDENEIIQVRGNVVNDSSAETIQNDLRKNVAEGAVLYTDQSNVYTTLASDYWHRTINHSRDEFVRGDVTTNRVEGYFALLKRCIKGTYIHMAPCHMDRYIAEQSLRYNLRKTNDGARFKQTVSQSFGTRLTWKELTGKAAD